MLKVVCLDIFLVNEWSSFYHQVKIETKLAANNELLWIIIITNYSLIVDIMCMRFPTTLFDERYLTW